MNDPALALLLSVAGAGAALAVGAAGAWFRRSGGASAWRERLAARHGRVARSLFAGPLGRVPGAPLVDPAVSLLAGTVAAVAFSVPAILLGGARRLPLVLACLPPAALLLARASLADRGRKAIAAIRRDLPGASLLLSLLLESGLSVPAAMPEVVASLEGRPLGNELGALRGSLSMGDGREEAYRRSMERVCEEDYHSFLSILRMGERTGSGLSRSLAELSARMVEAEGHRAEARAQKAPVHLLLPLVLCFFPSVALLILSPVLLPLLAAAGTP